MTLAPFGRRLLRVTKNERLGAYNMVWVGDPDGPLPEPGQFYMLAAEREWGGEDGRPYLPRAFSYARANDTALAFLLEAIGPGTQRLSRLEQDDGIWVTGPLGIGFTEPERGRRPLLVGGGIGAAPLLCWRDALGPDTPALLGFRSAEFTEVQRYFPGAQIATDDGAVGHHGFVTELLREELDRDPHSTIYACGPPPMLEAVRALAAERDVPAQLAMESGMACGFGACMGCVVPTKNGYVRLCVDGPVVDASDLETAAH
jgi:NAD(P)H-flavin reductase